MPAIRPGGVGGASRSAGEKRSDPAPPPGEPHPGWLDTRQTPALLVFGRGQLVGAWCSGHPVAGVDLNVVVAVPPSEDHVFLEPHMAVARECAPGSEVA